MRQIADRFLDSVRIPRFHGRKIQQALRIGIRRRIQGKAVGLDSECDRSIERIHGGKCTARQEGTAEAAQPLVPQFSHAGNIAIQRGGLLEEPHFQAAAHGAAIAQFIEAGVHLGSRAARPRASGAQGRPHPIMPLGQIFGDGQRVPHHGIAIDQAGHLAGGRYFPVCVPAGWVAKEKLVLDERDAQFAQQYPGPKGPRGIILVRYVKVVHVLIIAARRCRCART